MRRTRRRTGLAALLVVAAGLPALAQTPPPAPAPVARPAAGDPPSSPAAAPREPADCKRLCLPRYRNCIRPRGCS
ncbi:hypothetical protein [Roseococcus sp.]|uniref:hypothetical protein n=1 Tax=Roseococcus sp. TaxID=2109646 RepID=UPI003BA93530